MHFSQYLHEHPEILYSLHSRKHSKSLINKTSDLNDHHFLIRAHRSLLNSVLILCVCHVFALAINFISLVFTLYNASCVRQLLSKNFIMMMTMMMKYYTIRVHKLLLCHSLFFFTCAKWSITIINQCLLVNSQTTEQNNLPMCLGTAALCDRRHGPPTVNTSHWPHIYT